MGLRKKYYIAIDLLIECALEFLSEAKAYTEITQHPRYKDFIWLNDELVGLTGKTYEELIKERKHER